MEGGEEKERGGSVVQNEDPTPQDGWEKMVGVITNPGPPPLPSDAQKGRLGIAQAAPGTSLVGILGAVLVGPSWDLTWGSLWLGHLWSHRGAKKCSNQ